ncbi:hypothetical protein [Anthocerotibacter panamensis]|uniref:hypothetical protein n=1 Tax=Anthocerotibacter panamensis TaxID=2857077 RepID=UPI001C403335|nr:hypothetical protein [Anthocerotibacter panamensis]
MTQLFTPFTKQATSRILGKEAREIVQVIEWAYTVWVRFRRGSPRLVSKQAYRRDFLALRKQGALTVAIEEQSAFTFIATNRDNGNRYKLWVLAGMGYQCACEDFQRQVAVYGKGVCKHKIALNLYLGQPPLPEFRVS